MSPALQHTLTRLNRARLTPTLFTAGWREDLMEELSMRLKEGEMVEARRAQVTSRAALAPCSSHAFVAWFEQLEIAGPGQHDPLFDWLAEDASLDQMRWFLKQEVAGEAGFEDLVALTQCKLPERAKLELARNYWDEMGRGHATGMHGPMLAHLAAALELDAVAGDIVEESVELGNLMSALAANRRYAYQAIGALGVIELTAPARAAKVNEGMRRLGLHPTARQYFALHATLDVKHAAAWNHEVIGPLVASMPECAGAIAEGALMRLEAGARCFERYREELGIKRASRAA